MKKAVFIVTFVNPTSEEGREIWGVYEDEYSADMGVNNLYTEMDCDEDVSDFVDEWQVEIKKHEVCKYNRRKK